MIIPSELRKKYGWEAGDILLAEGVNDGVLLRPAPVSEDAGDLNRLLDETNKAYAALRTKPVGWRDELAERQDLEATLSDGLEPKEVWTSDRSDSV